jgi:predicted transcriptional regulator
MGSLLEMAANIVSSHASKTAMAGNELIQELQKVHASLQKLDEEKSGKVLETSKTNVPAMSLKKAFQLDQVFCLICGKGGMKTLSRHIMKAHHMKQGEYKKQFSIPSTQALTASNFSEARRIMAKERGLADNLVAARAARAAKYVAKKGPKTAKMSMV